LLQPELHHHFVLLDEPELGLHPHALGVLAALIKSAATRCQIIVCTQSAALLDEFDPADVIVAQRKDEATELIRLDPEQLKAWLEDYSLGELWRKNFLPGGGM
jgi:predicted ATPase